MPGKVPISVYKLTKLNSSSESKATVRQLKVMVERSFNFQFYCSRINWGGQIQSLHQNQCEVVGLVEVPALVYSNQINESAWETIICRFGKAMPKVSGTVPSWK